MPTIMFENYVALCTTDIYLMRFLCLQKKDLHKPETQRFITSITNLQEINTQMSYFNGTRYR